MMTTFRHCGRLGGAAIALLAGCAAGPAPENHFYRLQADAPETSLEKPVFPGTLEVDLFRSDALAGERLLLVRAEPDSPEIRRLPYHYWVDAPTRMVQIEVATYLRAAGAADRVIMPATRVEPDYVLRGRIVRLERVLGGPTPRARIELEISVVRVRGRALVLLVSYDEEVVAQDASIEATVVAFDRALTRILERFVADALSERARAG